MEETTVISQDRIGDVMDATVYSTDGNKIGKAGQVYLDDQTDRPEWVTVKTGMFGGSESFVPLAEANLDGDRLVVPYDKDRIKDAPRVDSDQGQLSQDQEGDLYRYYGLESGGPTAGGAPTTGTQGTPPGTGAEGMPPGAAVGRDTSGTTDDAMTRSEEQLHVGKEQQETGRARLRKHVVTEHETVTVPVEREEVRVEREPITDANRDAATSGPTMSDEEHEVTLRQEHATVDKEAVPVERVRMGKETVRDDETVSEDVRKEQIDADVPQDTTDTTRDQSGRDQ